MQDLYPMSYLGARILIPVLLVLCILILSLSNKSLRIKLWYCAGAIYIGALLAVTLFPIPLGYDKNIDVALGMYGQTKSDSIHLIPFATIIEAFQTNSLRSILRNIGGNFILLTPLGWFLAHFWNNMTVRKALIISFLVSLAIESTQLLMIFTLNSTRIANVDDLILNTVGGVLGYYIYRRGGQRITWITNK